MRCPRQCGADRLANERGICGAGRQVRVARAALHYWEEPPISGSSGSGAVFFSHCALQCVFCQNAEISLGGVGEDITLGRLAELMLQLQSEGAENINLVSASHYVPEVVRSVREARSQGLGIPIVWNTSGYETLDSLEQIGEIADVFLPDFKYWTPELAQKFSNAPDYPAVAAASIDRMIRLRPDAEFGKHGVMQRGVIVRHLVLPEHTRESKLILQHLYDNYGAALHVSIMRQYTPPGRSVPYAELNRTVRSAEYESVVRYAEKIGLQNVFVQSHASVGAGYIPAFSSSLHGAPESEPHEKCAESAFCICGRASKRI